MKLLKISILLILCSFPSFSQMNVGSLLSATSEKVTTTNFYFARPNDLTIIVNVVGFVQRPGRYEIASTIDLVNLLSLAGGPMPDGALSKVKITRIIKDGEHVRRKDLNFDLEDLTTIKAEELILSPGDFVSVDQTAWSKFRDGFGIVVSGAIIATAISQVIIATR